jgi:hypothetical protein
MRVDPRMLGAALESINEALSRQRDCGRTLAAAVAFCEALTTLTVGIMTWLRDASTNSGTRLRGAGRQHQRWGNERSATGTLVWRRFIRIKDFGFALLRRLAFHALFQSCNTDSQLVVRNVFRLTFGPKILLFDRSGGGRLCDND